MAEKAEEVVVPPHTSACLDDKGENYLVKIELPEANKRDMLFRMPPFSSSLNSS